MNELRLTAAGEYPHAAPMPEPLRVAMLAEIEAHMKAYGFINIRVEIVEMKG